MVRAKSFAILSILTYLINASVSPRWVAEDQWAFKVEGFKTVQHQQVARNHSYNSKVTVNCECLPIELFPGFMDPSVAFDISLLTITSQRYQSFCHQRVHRLYFGF